MTSAFKPKTVSVPFYNTGFSGGGLEGRFGSNGIGTVFSDPNRDSLIGGLSDAGANAANTYGSLYDTVKPGYNDLLNSRLTDLGNTARTAVGDLRQNLASRRILGSSFGNDTLTRLQNTIGQQRDSIIADNFLKSLDAQRQLTADQYNARVKQFQPALDNLNLEAGLASQLGSQGAQLLAQNAQINAQIQNTANAQGMNSLGSVLGTALGLGKSLFTGGLSGLFSSGSGVLAGGAPLGQGGIGHA